MEFTNDLLQIKKAESLFVEVDEEEYAKIVSKRRQDDFVEDDGADINFVRISGSDRLIMVR